MRETCLDIVDVKTLKNFAHFWMLVAVPDGGSVTFRKSRCENDQESATNERLKFLVSVKE